MITPQSSSHALTMLGRITDSNIQKLSVSANVTFPPLVSSDYLEKAPLLKLIHTKEYAPDNPS